MGAACGKSGEGGDKKLNANKSSADAAPKKGDNHLVSRNLVVDNPNKINQVYKLSNSKLGEGSYGSVSKATEIKSGSVRAVKAISKAGVKDMPKFLLEIELMKLMDHPNIIKLHETFQDARNVYLVMELAEGGELFGSILDSGSFNEKDAANIMKQIISAVYYLHSNHVAHRDLKPENFLFTEKGVPLSQSTLKIIDFGLSCRIPMTVKITADELKGLKFDVSEKDGHPQICIINESAPSRFSVYNGWFVRGVDDQSLHKFLGNLPLDSFSDVLREKAAVDGHVNLVLKHPLGSLHTKAGTPYYVAPEVLHGRHDHQCDIWSAGVIMYILLCGYPPFHGNSDASILKKVLKGQYAYDPVDWNHISQDAKSLIDKMLTFDPAKRITAALALEDEWIVKQAPNADNVQLQDQFVKKLRGFRAENKLKKVALFAMAQNINPNQIKEMKAIFTKLDKDGDGQLTFEEIAEGLKEADLPINDDMKELLQAIDSDNSGKIDYSEFIAATLSKKQVIQEDLCWAAFKIFDLDGNGKITKDELQEVLHNRDMLDEFGEETLKTIMEDADTNGDGEIDFHEFLEMMRTAHEGVNSPRNTPAA